MFRMAFNGSGNRWEPRYPQGGTAQKLFGNPQGNTGEPRREPLGTASGPYREPSGSLKGSAGDRAGGTREPTT